MEMEGGQTKTAADARLRGEKMKVKESSIQAAIEGMLIAFERRKSLVYIKNNSGSTKAGESFIRFGKPGSPDFLVFLKTGHTLHLEVKANKNKQTQNQIDYQGRVENLGHTYRVVRSVKEAFISLSELDHDDQIKARHTGS